MPRAAMAIRLITSFGMTPVVVMAVVVICSLALGVAIDVRFFIVALMLVLIVAPMLLAMLYFNYGLRRECFMNSLPHRLCFFDRCVVVEIFSRDSDENEKVYDVEIAYDDMHPYMVETAAIRVPVGKGKAVGFLWVPMDAFGDGVRFREAVDIIGKGLRYIKQKEKICVS